MFWSGNFILVRELNFLLKEENVTLSQVLEADDILQECKADNKALMQFLTRPDILAELITLITEEPPKNVEVSQQYRHASIACEVLTSPLSMLSDRLSLDTAQMNRLCDFINRDPPLNPLLASYFSKTVEMLLERSPKQDWYLYHIVCLRVLDFFKSRRDFLPNLLRHISTSAIADTFKYFIRLDDLFNKFIMEWLEEQQVIECLIQIICGTYVPEEFPTPGPEEPEKGQLEPSEKEDVNHKDDGDATEQGSHDHQNNPEDASPPDLKEHLPEPRLTEDERKVQIARTAAVASANAATLLCELIATGCAGEGAATRSRTSWMLVSCLQSERGVSALLQGMFTSSGSARRDAVVNGCKLLLQLLNSHVMLGSESTSERSSVELAVAPHLPLLHQALLHDPQHYAQEETLPGRERQSDTGTVGGARVMAATLLAHLVLSEVEEVSTTLLTLGTPAVLVEMFFRHCDNNFLHAAVHALVRNALSNLVYRLHYARHLFVECDLLTRLMDAFEDNENKQAGVPRRGYMGHVTLILRCISQAMDQHSAESDLLTLVALDPEVAARFLAFRETKLYPALQQYDTPLGGSFPSENTYEDSLTDTLAANYDFSYAMATATMDEVGDDLANDNEMCHTGLGLAGAADIDDDDEKFNTSKSDFIELARQRFGDDNMWDDEPEPEPEPETEPQGERDTDTETERDPAGAAALALREVLGEGSPWDSPETADSTAVGEGWAQFDGVTAPPVDPFGGSFSHRTQPFAVYWPYEGDGPGGPSVIPNLEAGIRALRLESDKTLSDAHTVSLANNLLTAMSAMTPDAIANIVNANLEPTPIDRCDLPAQITGLSDDATGLPVEATGLPVDATGLPVEGTGLPVDATGLPLEATGLPVVATGLPVEATGLPVDATGLLVEAKDLPDDATGLSVVNSLSSGSDIAHEPQNVPSCSVQSLSINLNTVKDTPSDIDTSSPRVPETKSKVNDIASVITEQCSNSPVSVLENTTKVLEVAGTPLEVSDTSER